MAGWFVHPAGYGDAQQKLRTSRVVLLRGAAGTGRRSTAISLLSERRTEGGGPIRVLVTRDNDQEGQEILPEDVAESARLLLDLSDVEDRQPARLLGLLAGMLNEVRNRGAVVAVILRPDSDRAIPDELRTSTVLIARPDGAAVFTRHLEAYGVPATPASEWAPTLRDFLARAPMSEIRDLASLTRQASDVDPAVGFATWTDIALSATTSRDTEVAEHLRAKGNERHRALTLASAMFEGCSTDVVVRAERRLLRTVRLPSEEEHELTGPDFGVRLSEINARVADGRVRFEALNYASAVRSYFWAQFPGLREGFHTWIVDCASLIGRAEHDSEELVARYSDQVLRIGRPDLVIRAVIDWASYSKALPLAATALTRGLTSPGHSRRFRQQCYEWATSRTVSPELARLVVWACVAVIAPQRLGQAIVRLHHLTRHRDEAVAAAARSGLAAVVEDDFALRRFLARLTELSRMAEPHNQRLFTTVVDPVRIIGTERTVRPPVGSNAVRGQLVACWAAVFSRLPKDEYTRPVQRWLTAQADRPHQGDLLTVLVQAAAGSPRSLGALHGITHRWLADPAAEPNARERRAVARRLLTEIDTARRSLRSTGADQDGTPR